MAFVIKVGDATYLKDFLSEDGGALSTPDPERAKHFDSQEDARKYVSDNSEWEEGKIYNIVEV